MQKTALCSRNAEAGLTADDAALNYFYREKKAPTFRFLTKTCLPARQALLVMKLTIILLLAGILNANAKAVSQTVSFSGKKVALVKAFTAIESQTGFTVFASKGLLKEANPVSIAATDMPLADFLTSIFEGQPLDYEIKSKTIFIKRKKSAPVAIVTAPKPEVKNEKPPTEITGVVLDDAGQPLAGASVTVKGTRTSVATNSEGRFTINAETNQILVFSYVGHQTQEVPLSGRTNVTITLAKASGEMEQVVMTALGISKKTKSLTYNVQEIKGEELIKVKDANFVNGLAGRVAGATVNTSATGIGGSTRVVLRGAKSLFRNNNALYVVDGIPLPNLSATQPNDVFQGAGQSGDGISNINPDDIASVSVLTGAAAAALYGSQAANGVVLITTKKGTAGKLNVNVSNSTSFFSPLMLPEFQNRYGSNVGSYSSWGEKLEQPGTYHPKDFFQTGTNVTNSISLSTGTDKNQTYFSASTVHAKGIIPNNKLKRYNFSARNTSNFLDDRLSLDLSAMYISAEEQNMLSQGQYFNPLVPIYLFPQGDDMERYKVYERFNPARNFNTQFWPYGDLGFQMQNPHWIINRDFFPNNKERYVLSAGLKYNIMKDLSIAARTKLDNNHTVAEKQFYASTAGLFASPAGYYSKNNEITRQMYTDVIASYNKQITQDFGISVNAGGSIMDTRYSLEGYGGNLLTVPNLFAFQNINQTQATPVQNRFREQTQSVFGSAQASYRNMLFLDVTARNDWSSALVNTTASSIFYPSVGLSGVLTDLFKIRSRVLSFAKLRASYSEVGNAPERFISIATYPIIGGFPATTSYMPATDLKPERTKSYEVGLNLRFLKNKINLDITAYQSSTFNQLFNPTLAPSTGFSSFYINAGEVMNRGIEAALGANLKLGQLQWNPMVTFSMNRNRIEQLLANYTNTAVGETVSVDSLSVGGTGSYMMALVKGGSIGDIYVNTLAVDEHGYINVGLVSQTVTAAPNTYIKAGNANPRYNIGFRNSFSYKNFELDFLLNARLGGVCVSVTQAIMDRFGVSKASADARDAGGVIINGEKIPAEPYYNVVGGGVAGVGSMYVYDATNLRLAEASLSYTFPASWFRNKVKAITVAATGRNLFLLTKAPFDPEATANTGTYYQGIDYFMQPSLRSIGFSAKFQF